MSDLLKSIQQKQREIYSWLQTHENNKELPLYSSVDVRDAGFKVAVVDTNLFPAGFNNLCEHGLEDAVALFKKAILNRVKSCKDILIIAEEHTRNIGYLENLRILQETIRKAGFSVTSVKPSEYRPGEGKCDLIIMNNDLIAGIPDSLKNTTIPIYPSLQAGWHSRLKSLHFKYTEGLVAEFAKIVGADPWFFSCLYSSVSPININEESGRNRLQDLASDLFRKIKAKYQEHQIKEKPFIFLKADYGTYGMGVKSFESPDEILNLNRRDRNKLYKGKGSQVIDSYLLQEGVPTTQYIDGKVGEVCIYEIANEFVGGFYRINSEKTDRENLNAKGMSFKKMCPHLDKYGKHEVHAEQTIFDIYRILARIAGIAAHREIIQLEGMIKK